MERFSIFIVASLFNFFVQAIYMVQSSNIFIYAEYKIGSDINRSCLCKTKMSEYVSNLMTTTCVSSFLKFLYFSSLRPATYFMQELTKFDVKIL